MGEQIFTQAHLTITDTTDLEWFYGTDLTHTSGTAVANIVGAAVGSMYLNTQTSLVYKCTAVAANGDQTWQYVGNMASGVLDNINIGGKNLLYDTNAPSLNPTGVGGCGLRYFSNAASLTTNGMGTEWTAISDAPISGIKYGAKHVCTQTGGKNHMISFYQAADRIDFVPGVQYTISYWAKSSVSGALVSIGLSGNTEWDRTTRYDYTIQNANTWEKVSVTFTYLGTSSLTAYNQQNTILYVGFQYNVVGTVWCCGYQVEEGNVATAWSEYPYTQTSYGGRNLIRNTNKIDLSSKSTRPNINGYYDDEATMYGSLEYGYGTIAATDDGRGIRYTGTAGKQMTLRLGTADEETSSRANGLFGLKAGETYTYSFDVKCKISTNYTGTAMIYLGAYLYSDIKSDGTQGETNKWNADWYSYPITYYPGELGTEKSAHVVFTFTIPVNAQRMLLSVRPASTNDSYVGAGDYIEMRNLKLECGNKATDWTPAPEDVDNAIADVKETADAAAPKTNAVKRTQRIYYRKNTSGAPATPGTASSDWVTNGNTESNWIKYNNWSTRVPPIADSTESTTKYLFLYTCEQRELASGTVEYTSVLLDDSTTVIDGGNIITGTVTANQIASNSISAVHLNVGDSTNLAQANENIPNSLPGQIWNGENYVTDGTSYSENYKLNIQNGYLVKKAVTQTYMMFTDFVPSSFRAGDEIYFEFYAHLPENVSTATIMVACWGYKNKYVNSAISNSVTGITITPTETKYSGTIKLTNKTGTNPVVWDTDIKYYLLGINNTSTPKVQIYIRKVIFRKKNGGELIVDGSITAGKIAASAITANKIAAGTITADKIAAETITADKINVTDLFSQNITASGNITGGTLNGSVITGSILNTAYINTGYDENNNKIGDFTLHYSWNNETGFHETDLIFVDSVMASPTINFGDGTIIGSTILRIPPHSSIVLQASSELYYDGESLLPYRDGNVINCDGVRAAGVLTTNKTQIEFFIPFSRPVVSGLKAALTGNWSIRHATGGYILNNAALTSVGTLAVSIKELGIFVVLTLNTASTFANNSTIVVSGHSNAIVTLSSS